MSRGDRTDLQVVHGLTPQQLRVARLVHQCATNKQIAAAMQLSIRRVETHLANIARAWELDMTRSLRVQIALRFSETQDKAS